MHRFLNAITNLGDAAFLLPCALVFAAALWRGRGRNAALLWLSVLIGCGTTIFVLKLGLRTCPVGPLHLRSPSGHAALSTLFYGAVAYVLAESQPDPWGRRILACFGALVALIAGSRILLSAHTLPELAIGVATGSLALIIFCLFYHNLDEDETRRIPPFVPVLGLMVLALVLYGRHLSVEGKIQTLANAGRQHLAICLPEKRTTAEMRSSRPAYR